MRSILGAVVAIVVVAPTGARAADFRDCRELFVTPLAAKTPEKKPNGAPWDNGSPMDPSLTAAPKDRPDRAAVVGPKQQDSDNPKWSSFLVQEGQPGAWLPIRVGDPVVFFLTDRDALADDSIDSFEVEVPKFLATTGVAFVVAGGRQAALSVRFSATDGKRACAGLDGPADISYTELPKGVLALPDDVAFASIQKHNRCNVNKSSPACRPSSYLAVIADVNGDGVHDTMIGGGPFEGGGEVVYLAMGFLPDARKEVFVGDCDKTGFLSNQEFTCTADGKTQVISLADAKGKVREATDAEVAKSDANAVEARASEARSNLKAVYTGRKSYFAERDSYATNALLIGFSPAGNRYTYFLAPSGQGSVLGPDASKHPSATRSAGLREAGCPLTFGTSADGEPIGLGVTGKAPNQEFIAYAIGNVDDDPDWDCWSIASFERKTKDGTVVPAGEPLHEKSDYP